MDKKYYIIIITIFIIIIWNINYDFFDIIEPPINEKKIAVIFPYREQVQQNRSQQLKDTLDYYTKLNKPNIDYYIIEQGNDKQFNRGVLINAGHDILKKSNIGYENEVHHDIDVQADESLIKYFYSDNVVAASQSDNPINKPIYNKDFFGLIVILPVNIMDQINGYSNMFWGWGLEDVNIRNRIRSKNIPIYVANPNIINIKFLPHIKAPKLKLDNPDNSNINTLDKKSEYKSGLADLKYTIISQEKLSEHVFKFTIDF
jgi:hypothetical protein